MRLVTQLNYIKYFLKLDKRNTILFLVNKSIGALFFSAETIVVSFLLDNIVSNISNKKVIICDVSVLFFVWGIKRWVEYFAQRKWCVLRKKVHIDLPEQIVKKKTSLSYITLENIDTQKLFKRIGNEPEKQFCEYFENNIYLLVSAIEIIGLLIVISTKNVIFGVILVIILVPYIVLSVKNGQISYEAYEESEELFRQADYYNSIINKRKYLEERTLFQYGTYFNDKWSGKYIAAIRVENKANRKVLFRTEMSNMLSTIFISGMFFVILCTSLGSTITIGFIISIMKSLINYIDKVSAELSKRMSKYEKGILFFEDIERFKELDKEVVTAKSNIVLPQKIKSIEFRNVSFAYPGSEKKVFDNLSLYMTCDKKYAIVGENGAGKSTLMKLLMGIYTNYSGTILINDIDIKTVKEDEINNLFAYVPQDITKYELPLNEYLNENEVDRVNKFFDEYEVEFMRAGENQPLLGKLEKESLDLSGGQWQLLAIVRASLSDKSVFILDEPTAAIDPIREAELYSKFQKTMEKEFTILITHRLGAARMADEIIVISDGSVVEKGSHSRLVNQGGIYSSMFNTQRKWYENGKR